MTSNQIAWKQAKETERSNKVKEGHKEREVRKSERMEPYEKWEKSTKSAKNTTSAIKDITGGVSDVAKIFASSNDPSWYNLNPHVSRDAANISYQTPIGAITPDSESGFTYCEPGILEYHYAPVLPHRGGAVDDIWIRSFQKLFMEIRKANSGARNYSVANIAQWVLSIQSLATLWMTAARAYSVISHYSGKNKYYGRQLCKACGFDPDDMQNNLSQYRYFLNLTAAQINQTIPVPQTMPWFKRSLWLAANIYADNQDVEHAHLTVFNPVKFYKYGDVEIFSPAYSIGSNITYDTFVTHFNVLYDAIIFSEDAGTIAGDILKAFPNGASMALPKIDVSMPSPVVYNELTNTQLRNLRLVPGLTTDVTNPAFTITENDDGSLTQTLKIQSSINYGDSITGVQNELRTSIVAHKSTMLPEETLEINMLNCFYDTILENGTVYHEVTDCGTEIVLLGLIHSFTTNTEGEVVPTLRYLTPFVLDNVSKWSSFVEIVAEVSKWYDCPIRLSLAVEMSGNLIIQEAVSVGSRGYVGFVPRPIYQNMMSTAVTSMLGI